MPTFLPSLQIQTHQLPFLLHILTEVPASLNFLLRPSQQLSKPAPQAHALIRQYAILLLSTNLVALVFAFRGAVDGTSANVAGALAVYHVAPLVRAVGRIVNRDKDLGKGGLCEPILHTVVHGFCFWGLARLYVLFQWG